MDVSDLRRSSEEFVLGPGIEEGAGESTLSPAALRFLGTLVRSRQPRMVIEFGSGLSTRLILQALRNIPGSRLFSVENSKLYLEQTRVSIPPEDEHHLVLVHAPLRPLLFKGKLSLTYSARTLRSELPSVAADLMLIDGPLAFRYGREAVLYAARPWLGDGTIVVLDDAGRPPEQAALSHWKAVWGDDCEIQLVSDLGKGLAVVEVQRVVGAGRVRFPVSECLKSWASTTRVMLRDLAR